MFQTNQGPSYPAHQFLFGATSAPSADDDHNGIFAAENTATSTAGCAAPSNNHECALINPQGVEFAQIFPCFEHRTLADLLEARGVSWRYYGSDGRNWRIRRQRHLDGAEFDQAHLRRGRSEMHGQGVDLAPRVQPISHFVRHFSPNCNLRGVSWVIPDAFNSDHMARQKHRRPVMGGVHRQRSRKQHMQEPRWQLVLGQHGHHHHLGRLGRLVRS